MTKRAADAAVPAADAPPAKRGGAPDSDRHLLEGAELAADEAKYAVKFAAYPFHLDPTLQLVHDGAHTEAEWLHVMHNRALVNDFEQIDRAIRHVSQSGVTKIPYRKFAAMAEICRLYKSCTIADMRIPKAALHPPAATMTFDKHDRYAKNVPEGWVWHSTPEPSGGKGGQQKDWTGQTPGYYGPPHGDDLFS